MLADEFPDYGAVGPESLGGSPVTLQLLVEDVDAAFDRAVAAGASALMPPTDMFWGDRYAKLRDPFGHLWSIATRVEPPTPERDGPGLPGPDVASCSPAPPGDRRRRGRSAGVVDGRRRALGPRRRSARPAAQPRRASSRRWPSR